MPAPTPAPTPAPSPEPSPTPVPTPALSPEADSDTETPATIPPQSAISLNNYITVASAGGNFERLSDALKSITDASATNRYTIMVHGHIIEDGNHPDVNGYINAKSHVDVIGQGATLEMWTPKATGMDYSVRFLDVTDSEWRDLNIIIKECWNQQDFEYTDNGSFIDIGIGCSYPIKIRGQTDRTCRLVNVKTSWDWQAGTQGWHYGGAILDLASPTLIDCEFRGGKWSASTGFIIHSIASPLLMNCSFIGGGSPGIEFGSVNYGLVIGNGSPILIGCLAVGGLGSINCHAIYIDSGEPTLIGCVGKPHEFSYVFTYDPSNPPTDNKFRPDVGVEYRYLIRDLRLAFAPQSNDWTISVGISPGSGEIASIAGSTDTVNIYNISSIGYVLNTDEPKGGILESPPRWEITGSSFVQLWKYGITSKAYAAMNWYGPFFEMPAYYCTFVGDFYNVRPVDTLPIPEE
ncbi:hypothetical protein ES703_62257 [subsurface metagenome]